MRKLVVMTILLAAAAVDISAQEQEAVKPAKVSKDEVAGRIFERDSMVKKTRDTGTVTRDVTTLRSSDDKFTSGVYEAGIGYFEYPEPYGVDEFMFFLEGSVTLTSTDGTVQTINAGEAVTIPKEWTGIWDTQGYTKFYVIYRSEGDVSEPQQKDVKPAKIHKNEVGGLIFERDSMVRNTRESGTVTLNVVTLVSSDEKFTTGMYQAGKGYFDSTDPYGVDEFMFFLEGSVKLTSTDGTVQTINSGEAVTIPKEWVGIWDTEGYTKFYVIYRND